MSLSSKEDNLSSIKSLNNCKILYSLKVYEAETEICRTIFMYDVANIGWNF
jgi:hypothetical protein